VKWCRFTWCWLSHNCETTADASVILRGGTPGQPHDLSDPATLNLTVQSGDVITVTTRPQEFYYIGGRINYPGQKVFQPGITLLQAFLAAGGTGKQDNRVEISREGADGRLVTIGFTIKQIKSGAVQDPKLQPATASKSRSEQKPSSQRIFHAKAQRSQRRKARRRI
jgi:hypothetical protein